MVEKKYSYLSIKYQDDYGQDVWVSQKYDADRTWMEFIPQFNQFLSACGFVSKDGTFVEEAN